MRAILIDDEPLALDFLESQLMKLNGVNVERKFTFFNVDLHKELLESIDLVFLDIEMPETNGLELAERILEINPRIFIVFSTAYHEYAVKAFELNVLDYILKPVQTDRLKNTLQRILQNTSQNIPTEQTEKLIYIHTGKDVSLEVAGKLHPIGWRTAKAKELFLYLLHHQGKIVRKDFLADYFWADLEVERAASQMYTTIYHIRKALRDVKEHITIKSKQDGYVLLMKNVIIDICEWEKQLKRLQSVDEQTIQEFENIMNRYPGPYLGADNYIWAEAERYRLEEIWLETAYQIAYHHKEKNNDKIAKRWYNEICRMREEEETAHFQLMKLYAKENNKRMVNHQYGKLARIYEDLNIPIDGEIANWFEQWERDDFIEES